MVPPSHVSRVTAQSIFPNLHELRQKRGDFAGDSCAVGGEHQASEAKTSRERAGGGRGEVWGRGSLAGPWTQFGIHRKLSLCYKHSHLGYIVPGGKQV